MGKWKEVHPPPPVPPPLVDIQWFTLADHESNAEIAALPARFRNHDAEAEIMALPTRFRDKALAQLARLAQLSKAQFRIKPTYVDYLFEAKSASSDGNLRLLFVYGQNSVTWCIGGFVKSDDAHGNRLLASYAALAKVAKNL